jgi:hypothetical protein
MVLSCCIVRSCPARHPLLEQVSGPTCCLVPPRSPPPPLSPLEHARMDAGLPCPLSVLEGVCCLLGCQYCTSCTRGVLCARPGTGSVTPAALGAACTGVCRVCALVGGVPPPTVEIGVGRLSRSAPPAFAAPPTQAAAAEVVGWQCLPQAPLRVDWGPCQRQGSAAGMLGAVRACPPRCSLLGQFPFAFVGHVHVMHRDTMGLARWVSRSMGTRSVGSKKDLAVWHLCKCT